MVNNVFVFVALAIASIAAAAPSHQGGPCGDDSSIAVAVFGQTSSVVLNSCSAIDAKVGSFCGKYAGGDGNNTDVICDDDNEFVLEIDLQNEAAQAAGAHKFDACFVPFDKNACGDHVVQFCCTPATN